MNRRGGKGGAVKDFRNFRAVCSSPVRTIREAATPARPCHGPPAAIVQVRHKYGRSTPRGGPPQADCQTPAFMPGSHRAPCACRGQAHEDVSNRLVPETETTAGAIRPRPPADSRANRTPRPSPAMSRNWRTTPVLKARAEKVNGRAWGSPKDNI